MSAKAFSQAVKEATFAVKTTADGGRTIVRKAEMDREEFSNFNRGTRGGRSRGIGT